MGSITDKIRNAAKAKKASTSKSKPAGKAKASKPKAKPKPRKAAAKKSPAKRASKPKSKPKAKPRKAAAKPKTAAKPKAKKATTTNAANPKGVHPNPQPMVKGPRMFTEIFLADLIKEACAATGVAHAELARRLEISGPRIPEILRSENITESLAAKCFRALGVDLEIRMVKKGSK